MSWGVWSEMGRCGCWSWEMLSWGEGVGECCVCGHFEGDFAV